MKQLIAFLSKAEKDKLELELKSIKEKRVNEKMKKLIRLFLMSLVSVITSIIVEDLSIAQESVKNKVNIKKIFEKTFDEEIEDVVFGKAKMQVNKAIKIGVKGLEGKKNPTEEIEIDYLKVVKTKNKVIWYTKYGEKIKELSLEKFGEPSFHESSLYSNNVYLLKSGKVVIENDSGQDMVNIYVYDDKGNLKWEKNNWEGGVEISGNEKYISTRKSQFGMFQVTKCLFYEIDGKKLWEHPIDFSVDVIIHPLFKEGVLIIERSKKPMRNIKIKLIGVNGKKLWEKNLNIQDVRYIKSNDKDDILIYGVISYNLDGKLKELQDEIYILYYFNKNGNLLWQHNVKGFTNSFHELTLAKKSSYLAGFTLITKIWVMNIASGEIVWERPLEEFKIEKSKYCLLDISDDGKFVGLFNFPKGTIKYGKENLILLDGKNGKILEADKSISGKFLDSNILLKIRDRNIELYQIEE